MLNVVVCLVPAINTKKQDVKPSQSNMYSHIYSCVYIYRHICCSTSAGMTWQKCLMCCTDQGHPESCSKSDYLWSHDLIQSHCTALIYLFGSKYWISNRKVAGSVPISASLPLTNCLKCIVFLFTLLHV